MSIQNDLETALVVMLEANILNLDAEVGPKTVPQLEGSSRFASVRRVSSTGVRLEMGQTEWADQILITIYWAAAITRLTLITEWEAFAAALLADQYLGGSIAGLVDAWLSDFVLGDAVDASIRTITATIETKRIE